MSSVTTSHAYGIGLITLLISMSVVVVFYTSFYLPESLTKPSVAEDILNPEKELVIEIVLGAMIDGNDNYVPKSATALLTKDNKVIWKNNDNTPHTVNPNHRYSDSYSGEFGTSGVIMPGESYEFLFTEPQEIPYYCEPHPWMTGTIKVEKGRF